ELRSADRFCGRQRIGIHAIFCAGAGEEGDEFHCSRAGLLHLRRFVVEPERKGENPGLHLDACGNCVWRMEDARIPGATFVLGAAGVSGKVKMVTMRDVAQASGFSPATVSIVLNNAPLARYIAPATTKRIEDAAKKLGYRP